MIPTQTDNLPNQPVPVTPGANFVPVKPDAETMQKMYDKLKTMNISPSSIGATNQKTLLEASLSPEELANNQYYQYIASRDAQKDTLGQSLTGAPEPGAGIMRPLEEALKTKIGLQKEALGESELFKQAGIDPFMALSNSLKERSNEMNDKYNSFSNTLLGTAEAYNATYSNALKNYKLLTDEYDKEVERIDSIIQQKSDYENTLKLYEEKAKIDKQYQQVSISDQLAASEAGKVIVNGNLVDKGDLSNIFTLEGNSKYKSTADQGGWQCGEASNKITDGLKVGDSWSSKMANTRKDNPQVGNNLALPLGARDENGKLINGHIGTVIGYDPDSGVMSTVEWNKNLDGQRTFESYTINEDGTLTDNKSGGVFSNWGINNNTLKPEFEKGLVNSSITGSLPPEYQQRFDRANAGVSTQVSKSNKETFNNAIKTGDQQIIEDALIEIERAKYIPRAEKIYDDYAKSVQDYQDIKNKTAQMDSLYQSFLLNPDQSRTFIDQGLITLYNKILDPTSVVRESEYNRTPENLSLINRVQGTYDKLLSGGAGLTDEDRKAAVEAATTLTEGASKTYEENIRKATQRGEAAGIPEYWLKDYLGVEKETPKYTFDLKDPIVQQIDKATGLAGVDITYDELQALLDNDWSLQDILNHYLSKTK